MRSVSVRLADLNKVTIPIGFVGENLHTQVRIDCVKLFEDYPNAVPGLTVNPPMGDTYPAVVTRDVDYVIWDIEDSDLTVNGNGEIQLSFFVDEVIAKSYIGRIRIEKSLVSTGDVPTPIDNWIDEANEKLAEVEQWNNVTAEASTLAPGTSATVEITEENGHNKFEFGIPRGDKGDTGTPGFSPVIVVTDITGGHRVSITDVGGTQTVDIMDGEKGDTGNGIESAVLNQDYTLTLNFTDGTHYTTPSIRGAKGETGDTGNGIASVTLNQDYTLTITYTNGQSTTTASIRGEKGETGATPIIAIGTVTTLSPGSDATATIDTTDPEHPVLSFGIPEGYPGEVTEAELNAVAESKADIIHDTASGTIATFPDGADGLPMTVTAEITPVQDLHGQDSPYPAGGGKNKFNIADAFDGTDQTVSGTTITKAYTGYSFDLFNGTTGSSSIATTKMALTAGTYTINGTITGTGNLRVYGCDSEGNVESTHIASISSSIGYSSFTLASDGYITMRYSNRDALEVKNLQIESGSSATSYAPYENLCPISGWTGASVTVSPTLNEQDGTTYSIAFPSSAGTVYGGTLTVNKDGSGKLIIDTVSDTVAIDNTWTDGGSSKFYKTNALSNRCAEGSSAYAISNLYLFSGLGNTNTSDMTTDKRFYMKGYNKRILIRDDRYSTLSDFVTAMSGQSIQVVYRLYTPVEIDLTELEVIETLKGVNNVWADCGDTSVEYCADTRLYIEKLTKPTEDDMIANSNIPSGTFFMVGNSLFLSTHAIAQGATITPGTNCTAISLADALNTISQ